MTDSWDEEALGILEKWDKSLNAKPKGLLYHYTDFDGLHGIISENNLRATYSKVLNDGSERAYGERVVSDALKQLVVPESHSNIDSNLKELSFRTFVTSFCECEELLSMWRAYAGHGGGYCMGFGYSGLSELCSLSGGRVLGPTQVFYGAELSQQINVLLQSLSSLLNRHFDNASPLLEFASLIAPMVKDKAFKEEKEWRLTVIDPQLIKVCFRAGHSNIKPYIKLSPQTKDGATSRLPLVKVICGPTLRQEDRPDEIVKWMLEKYGYNDVVVGSCGIPYRL